MTQDATMELVQLLLCFVWVGHLDDDVSVSKPEIATRGSVQARRGRVAVRHVIIVNEFLLVRRVGRSDNTTQSQRDKSVPRSVDEERTRADRDKRQVEHVRARSVKQ